MTFFIKKYEFNPFHYELRTDDLKYMMSKERIRSLLKANLVLPYVLF
jgi:hypothetical protein